MGDLDRVVCRECHEDAVIELRYQGHAYPVPLCGRCADMVEQCPECENLFWGPEGQRIVGNSRHCKKCAAKHPARHQLVTDAATTEAFDRR